MALQLGLLFEITLRRDAADLGQVTRVEHFTDDEVFDLFLLSSFFFICVDHIENLHSSILTAFLMVYIFMIELLPIWA